MVLLLLRSYLERKTPELEAALRELAKDLDKTLHNYWMKQHI
jgi:hypothetical protein